MRRGLAPKVGVALMLTVLGWLIHESTKLDVGMHIRTIERFRQIKQLDATLDLFVLQSRDGLLNNYDAIVQTELQIETHLAGLEGDASRYFAGPASPLRRALVRYREARSEKSKLIEGFKSHNAVLRNSLSYFPVAVHGLINNGPTSLRSDNRLHSLLADILVYNQAPNSRLRERIDGDLSRLLKDAGAERDAILSLSSHVSIIQSHKSEVDDLIRQITLAKTNTRGDELFHLYNREYMLEEEHAAIYERLLALLAFLMAVYLVWIFARLNKARNELKDSLQELEFQKFTLDQHAIVSIADRTGRILYANDKFSEVSQYRNEELLGQDHRLLNSGHHPHEFFKEMWATIGKGRVWRGEVCNRAKDGSLYWVDSTIVPFMDEKGMPVRYVSVRTDITNRKKLEEVLQGQRDFYERISETLGEGLYVQDADGYCVFMNGEAERLLGWNRAEFIGKPVHNTIHTVTAAGEPLPDSECSINRMTRTGERMITEDQVFMRRDGSVFPVAVVSQGIFRNGEYQGAVVAFQDITERKQTEVEMKAAKEAAEEASRTKSDFLTNMSHEIRTPMNGIIGMTRLALETELDAEQKEYLELVKSSADALLEIINDILDFSKVDAGKMELERVEFSLPDLLSQATRSIALRAHQKGLELLLDIDPQIPEVLVGDPGRLRQVVLNLIGNAIKFTEHGEIVVKTVLSPNQNHLDKITLYLSVSDTGIGIPEEKFQTIFESFSQADSSTTRKYGGTGLGLTITTRLVELMGGCIWLESEVGQGSTFFIEIVLDKADVGILPHYEAAPLKDMPVLVVDDNASNRSLATELLRRWGMRPHAVADAHQAMLELEKEGNGYRLLLLDARMPDIDGFAVVEYLRTRPELAVRPIMMLTSAGQRDDAVRCRELGIPVYLLKPYSQSDLFDTIMNALGLSDIAASLPDAGHEMRHNRRKLQVLLAEDNSINQVLATRLLQKFGHSVDVARDGLVAVEKWQAGDYDLILMDVDMPQLNGYDATARIRELEVLRGGHIPVVGLTAHAMQGSREACLAAGMDGYLSKPIDTEALWAELESIGSAAPKNIAVGEKPSVVAARAFDLDKSLALMDNDMELFREMVQIYLAEYPGYLKKLGDAIRQGDADRTRHCSHMLKGMIAVFSVPAITAVAERIETQHDRDQSLDFIELQQELDWLSGMLREAMASG